MKRKIYDYLLKWKNEEKGAVALLVEGARRVGKNYTFSSIEKFRNRFPNHVHIPYIIHCPRTPILT